MEYQFAMEELYIEKKSDEEVKQLLNDMRRLMYSMVSAFTKAIDEWTPYNASHTMWVARYTEEFIDYLNETFRETKKGFCFSPEEKEQIVLAAHLHDIGKLVIPLKVMNKATRLGEGGMERLHERYLLIKAYLKIDYMEGRIAKDEWEQEVCRLDELERRVEEINKPVEIGKRDIDYFVRMSERYYEGEGKNRIPWLTLEELKNLQIQKGTLNEDERKIMEYHVTATEKILEKIEFGKAYQNVLKIATGHHEFLDGTGYPKGLKGDEICVGMRILTLSDIYDSLVARDRPYKKPMKASQARNILKQMAEEGKLDRELTELFCNCMTQKQKEKTV